MGDKLFRIKIIGGYNKEDVHSYISKLEEELTRAHERLEGQNEPGREPEKKAEADEDVIVLRDTAEETKEKNMREKVVKQEGADIGCGGQAGELAAIREELEQVKNELIDTKVELGISKKRCEQSEQKKESLLELIQHLVDNYSGLQTSQYYLTEQIKDMGRMEKRMEIIQNNLEHILRADVSISDSF